MESFLVCSSLPNRVNITVSPDKVGLKLPKVIYEEEKASKGSSKHVPWINLTDK